MSGRGRAGAAALLRGCLAGAAALLLGVLIGHGIVYARGATGHPPGESGVWGAAKTIVGPLTVSGGSLVVGSTLVDGALVVHSDQATDRTVTLAANTAMSESWTWNFPPDKGNAGNVLVSNGGSVGASVSWTSNLTAINTVTMVNGGAYRTGTTVGNTALIQAYDTDTGPAYVTVFQATAGTTTGLIVGEAASTLSIVSTALNVTTAGAVSGISTLSTTGAVTVDGSADVVQHTVQCNATQSTNPNCAVVEDSGGDDLLAVRANTVGINSGAQAADNANAGVVITAGDGTAIDNWQWRAEEASSGEMQLRFKSNPTDPLNLAEASYTEVLHITSGGSIQLGGSSLTTLSDTALTYGSSGGASGTSGAFAKTIFASLRTTFTQGSTTGDMWATVDSRPTSSVAAPSKDFIGIAHGPTLTGSGTLDRMIGLLSRCRVTGASAVLGFCYGFTMEDADSTGNAGVQVAIKIPRLVGGDTRNASFESDIPLTGTVWKIASDASATLTGNLTGGEIDLDTNVTPGANVVTAFKLKTSAGQKALDIMGGNLAVTGTTTMGGGTPITKPLFGSCTVDIGNVLAGAVGTTTCAASGVTTSFLFVEVTCPTTYDANFSPHGADAGTNVITVGMKNIDLLAAHDPASVVCGWRADL